MERGVLTGLYFLVQTHVDMEGFTFLHLVTDQPECCGLRGSRDLFTNLTLSREDPY